MAGQVPDQSGFQLPGLTQPNRNALPQTPNLGGVLRSTNNMDPEFLRARSIMQEKIYDILLQRQQHPVTEVHKRRFKDFAKRLEVAMLETATSQEEYLNLETLESRLLNCIRRPSINNHNQQYPQHVSSSPIGTMIPTPGMPHVVNSNVAATSSVDASMIVTPGCNSMASPSVNSGSMFPTGGLHGNSLSRSDGLSNGYQPSSSSFSIGSGGTMSSMGAQRIASQMIPTPGFTGSNNSYMNVESSDNSGVFSSVDSSMVSQPQQQEHLVGGQNNNVMQNLGSQMGGGMRSGLQQKSFAYSSGAINSGLGLIGNNRQHTNESGFADACATTYANSPKHPQQHFDQNQQPPVQGDGYGLNNVDSFASGNFYTSATSSGPMMNSQNLNSVKLPAPSQTSSVSSHSNLHGMQLAAHLMSQAMNQFEKLNIQSSFTSREGLVDHQQQYLQHSQQFQQPEQYAQQQFDQSEQYAQKQFQLKMQSQQPQHLFNSDAFN